MRRLSPYLLGLVAIGLAFPTLASAAQVTCAPSPPASAPMASRPRPFGSVWSAGSLVYAPDGGPPTATAEAALRTRARHAYEVGRGLRGLRRAVVVVPMAGLSPVGRWAVRRDIAAPVLAAAVLAAGLADSLGCLAAGLGGVLGLAAGLGLGTAPLIVLRRV